ncbi:MAG: UbiA prenyltransferase family protein [Prevotella sp.]|nr:UbiA prenyltransferase family protein [Candidatus Equicola stercoris]
MIPNIFLLMRPNQWSKNIFVFLPMFFGRHLTDLSCWWPNICAFLAFCFASSGIYCLNDIYDAESDSHHPKKCRRPLACGSVSRKQAYYTMIVCWILSFGLIFTGYQEISMKIGVASIVALYILLNIAYCLRLKLYSVIDVFIIALGFVLRVISGGISSHVELSHWIVLMTFLLTLFIAIAKRRDDVVVYENSGVMLRDSIGYYNISFINMALCIVASVTMICYIMYTVSDEVISRIGNNYLYTTSIFVLAGLVRYLQLTIVEEKSGSPSRILIQDHFILGCILAWSLTFTCLLYL